MASAPPASDRTTNSRRSSTCASLSLRPNDDLTSVTLANLFEQMKKDELAIAAYETVPQASPLREDAQIQAALVLDSLGHGRGDQTPQCDRRRAAA